MTTIRQKQTLCAITAIVDRRTELEAHTRWGLTQCSNSLDYVSGAQHKSRDGTRLVQHLQWKTATDQPVYLNYARFDQIPSTRRLMKLVESGESQMDVRTYNVADANTSSTV